MKTVKLEIDEDTAASVLADWDRKISEIAKSRDELNNRLEKLAAQAKSLRAQLSPNGAENGRATTGDNRSRIKEFLSGLPDNRGARMVEIRKGTGIGASSVAFTLGNYKDDFMADDGKVWKLKL